MMDIRPRLASFATRPPTPPRQRIPDTPKPLHDNDHFLSTAQDAFLDTPEQSPSSSAEYFGGLSGKQPKRVIFSPWTKYHKPLDNGNKSFSLENQIRVLPPSRECKSSKSILKPSTTTAGIGLIEALPNLDQNSSISVMLASATQHLASHSQNSRIDAYTALLGCLSAYNDVPDVQELVEKLPDLTRFIHRDISAQNEETGSMDTHLVAQALKLLIFFVDTPRISDSLPDDFCSFMIEKAILSLEDQSVPKIVTTHYMLFLTRQNFSPKHTGIDRMNGLITALDGVANIVRGNRVVGQRLMIYRRLLTQAKPVMIARIEDWIHHLITGMLSTIKDIRSWAICLGLEASLLLGTTKSVSQACMDMFNRESPEGKKMFDCLASRLTKMGNSKDDGIHVPQIWSIVILFLRSRRNQLEGWEFFKPWLLILQKCFNSGEPQIKLQANIAWNRLIFAIDLDSSTSPAMVKMLRQPIASQLDRKKGQKISKYGKQIARSSYCTLLYYAFRPSATHAQLDQYWEEYILQMPICDQRTSSPDVDFTCDILAALLSSSQPKIWDENRANLKEAVKPDELPCLDPRWVRLRSAKIFKVFENLLTLADWQPRKDTEVPIIKAWQSLTTSLGEASNKEVKVSMETMAAMADLVNTVKHFWQQGLKTEGPQGASNLIDRFELLLQEAVDNIGTIPFTEKRLMQSANDFFEAAETPSSRSIRSQGPLSSPVSSLLNLLVSSVDQQITGNFRRALGKFVDLALRSETSRRTQLAVLRDLVESVSFEGQSVSKGAIVLWQLIAKAAMVASRPPKANEKRADSSQNVGHEYRDASKILEIGLRQHFAEAITEWLELAANISHRLRQEICGEAVTLIIVEPLAAALHQLDLSECYEFNLASSLYLLQNSRWPQSRQTLDRARKMLWGVGSVSQKNANPDPFDHLYSMTNIMLNVAYSRFQSTSPIMMKDLISAVTSLIFSCPLSLKGVLLKQIQNGLSVWIEDTEGLVITPGSARESTTLYCIVMNLWAEVVTAIETAPKIDGRFLLAIETLMISSLKSKRKAVINESIQMWNRTFGAAKSLEYPTSLLPVLLKLRTLTDISLPAFPEGIDIDVSCSPLHFTETQLDKEQPVWNQKSTPPKLSPRPLSEIRLSEGKEDLDVDEGSSHRSALLAGESSRQSPAEQMLETTPKSTPKTTSKITQNTTPKTRLRHDDSQIQFAAIESSPLVPETVDSQSLTNHQKEVRERQRLERGTMFPDISSTPNTGTREQGKTPLKLILKGAHGSHTKGKIGDNSRILSRVDDTLDDVFGCSPTPRSSRRNADQLSFISESSPPISGHTKLVAASFDDDLPSTLHKLKACSVEIGFEKMEIDTDLAPECHNMHSGEVTGASTILHDLLPQQQDTRSEASIDHDRGDGPPKSPAQDLSGMNPSPESEIFLDGTSDPIQNIQNDVQEQCIEASANPTLSQEIWCPSDVRASGEMIDESNAPTPSAPDNCPEEDPNDRIITEGNSVIQIVDSFQEPQRSQLTSEDNQIAAQLVSDLERASSQAEAEMKGALSATKGSMKAGRKRTNSFDDLLPTKKPKVLPQPQAFQVVIDSTERGEADGEDICLEEDHRVYSPARETMQKPSPSHHRSSRVISRKLRTKEKHSRRARSSAASDAPSQESWPIAEPVESESDSQPEESATVWPSQRRSMRLNLPSVEDKHAQNGLSTTRYESDEGARLTDFPRRSGFVREGNGEGSGLEQMEREALGDDSHATRVSQIPPEPMAVVREMSTCDDHGNQSPARSLEVHNSASQNHAMETEKEYSASPSKITGLCSSEGRAVQPTIQELSEHVAIEMQAPRHEFQGILAGFRRLLGDIRRVRLGAEEEREMIGVLFDCVGEVHEAGRRSTFK